MIPDKRHIVSPKILPSLYHISFQDHGSSVWNPLTPAGSDLTKPEDEGLGEPTVPRICVSTSLERCFRAVWSNVDKYFRKEKYPYMDFYVYSPDFKGKEEVISPQTLTKERWVWDAHVTDEHWILTKVQMNLIGQCRIHNTLNKGILLTRVFNDPKEPRNSEVGPKHIKITTSLSLEQKNSCIREICNSKAIRIHSW